VGDEMKIGMRSRDVARIFSLGELISDERSLSQFFL